MQSVIIHSRDIRGITIDVSLDMDSLSDPCWNESTQETEHVVYSGSGGTKPSASMDISGYFSHFEP